MNGVKQGVSKSILNNDQVCYRCGRPTTTRHHIYNGPFRNKSEKFGCWVYLCNDCHTGRKDSVHKDRKEMDKLKIECQKKWEELYGVDREKFIKIFGKNYL